MAMIYIKKQHYQKGIVLLAAMIMIITVTGIAVSLMSSSTVDVKMSNAAQESDTAENQVKADTEKAIKVQMRDANKLFEDPALSFPTNGTGSFDISVAGSDSNILLFNTTPEQRESIPCPRKFATSGETLCCNMTRIDADLAYGKSDKHSVVIHSGIAQEVICM